MSVHSSLKASDTMKRHRSVLSRMERVRILQEKGSLDPSAASVLGLPKVKHLKIRIRKEKSASAVPDAAAAGSAPGQPAAPAAAAPAKSKKPASS